MSMAERAYEALGLDRLETAVDRWTAPKRKSFFSQWDSLVAVGLIAVPAALALAYRFRGASATAPHRRIRDVMIDKVMTIDANATVREAAELMSEGNVGALPVVENGEVKGIVTDRDLVVRCLARYSDASSVRVGECATKILVSARPDWSVDEAMRVMSEHQIGRLPVVDDRNQVIGMVTLSSLALRSGEQEETLETAQKVARRSARGPLRSVA
jgi:CBS domain-containing protein